MSHRRRRCSIFLFFLFHEISWENTVSWGEGARIPTLFHLFPAVSYLRQSASFAVSEKYFFWIPTSCTVKPACICIYIFKKYFFWEEKSSHTLGSKGRGQKPDNYCPFAWRKGEHLTSLLLDPMASTEECRRLRTEEQADISRTQHGGGGGGYGGLGKDRGRCRRCKTYVLS